MNERDLTLIATLSPSNPELAGLVSQHADYEEQLRSLTRERWLAPQEQALVKQLKRRKLRGRDRIEAILRRHRD